MSPPRRPLAYALAPLVVLAATLLRWPLWGVLGTELTFLLYWPAVFLVAGVGGLGPGLLAAVLSALAADYFLVEPRFSFGLGRPADMLGIVVFVVLSSGVSLLCEWLHALRESAAVGAERLRVTLSSIGDAVVATDAAGRVTFLNAVAETLTGWSAAEAAGRPLGEVFRIVNEETRRPAEDPVGRAVATGTVVGLANGTTLLARGGAEYVIEDSAAPIRSAKGEVIGCVLVFRDTTDQRAAARALADEQRRSAAVLESISDAFVALDAEWRFVYVNAEAERLNGVRREQLLGRSHWEVFPEARGTVVEESFRRAVAEGVSVEFENYFAPLGVWFAVKCYPSPGGGLSVYFRDVTETRRSADRLREASRSLAAQQAFTQDVLSRLPVGVLLAEADGTLRFSNEEAHRILDYTYQPGGRLEGYDRLHGITGFRDGRQLAAEDWPLGRALTRGEVVKGEEIELVRADGSRLTIAVSAAPVPAPGGGTAAVAVFADVSDRKRLEAELREQAACLAEQDRRKDEFLATLGHELRNPLAPVRNGLAALEAAGDDPARVGRVRAMMQRQVAHMARLIDDLLDVSRITRGTLELRRRTVDLSEVLAAAVETSTPLLEQGRHALEVAGPPGPVWVDADPDRLAQVFSNLLNNAAKYTPPGGHVRLEASADGQAEVRVRDDGTGIPPAMLERVFDLFTQIHPGEGRVKSGLGVGLSLVRGLVGMHGGSVEARSDGVPGRGSEFVVRLPLADAPAPAPSAGGGPAAPATPRKVLVVDDNVDAADSLATLARAWGHEVRVARDGGEALAAAAEFAPDVVVLDIGMPGMDGHEVAARLPGRPLRIALTGYGHDAERQRAVGVFDHFLVKPADLEELRAALDGPRPGG